MSIVCLVLIIHEKGNIYKRAHPTELPRFFFLLRFHTKVLVRNIGKHCLAFRKKLESKKLWDTSLMNFSNKLKDLCQIKGTQTLNATKMLQILVMTGQFFAYKSALATSQLRIWRHMVGLDFTMKEINQYLHFVTIFIIWPITTPFSKVFLPLGLAFPKTWVVFEIGQFNKTIKNSKPLIEQKGASNSPW